MKVYQCINAVQKQMASDGITKGRKNQQQGYAFRGIDDVLNALSPVLAGHGLCILPRIVSRECVERQTKNGGALFYVTVEAEFDFIAIEDGSKHTVKTYGEAMDSADKATNKAMSAAYKYAAILAFAIPTEGDNDADAQSHDVASRKPDVAAILRGISGSASLEVLRANYDAALSMLDESHHPAINKATAARKKELTQKEPA